MNETAKADFINEQKWRYSINQQDKKAKYIATAGADQAQNFQDALEYERLGNEPIAPEESFGEEGGSVEEVVIVKPGVEVVGYADWSDVNSAIP